MVTAWLLFYYKNTIKKYRENLELFDYRSPYLISVFTLGFLMVWQILLINFKLLLPKNVLLSCD